MDMRLQRIKNLEKNLRMSTFQTENYSLQLLSNSYTLFCAVCFHFSPFHLSSLWCLERSYYKTLPNARAKNAATTNYANCSTRRCVNSQNSIGLHALFLIILFRTRGVKDASLNPVSQELVRQCSTSTKKKIIIKDQFSVLKKLFSLCFFCYLYKCHPINLAASRLLKCGCCTASAKLVSTGMAIGFGHVTFHNKLAGMWSWSSSAENSL